MVYGSALKQSSRRLFKQEEYLMRRFISYLAGTLFVALFLTACGTTSKMIARESRSERTDIFREVAHAEAIPEGYADVEIKARIKTPPEGYYILEPKRLQGSRDYPFVINIDGQAAVWKVDGVTDTKPKYKTVDGRKHDPEAGEGVMYVLEKKIRLAAGPHKVFLGLPEEPYYLTIDITVMSGKSYVLEFRPRYPHKSRAYRPTFLAGLRYYEPLFRED
jgi:hypothetical protein